MGRDELTFSIFYEFKVSLRKIKAATDLLIRDDASRELKLKSRVSPESFSLLCRHLSGESITVTETTADDLRFELW